MKYTADFETTTDRNDCRVWAWGVCEIGNPDFFRYGNSIEGFFEFMEKSKNSTFYFHNLRFDSDWILIYLFEHGFKHVTDRKDEATNTFTTLISDAGQFYSIKIIFEKKGKRTKYVNIYDSLKMIPFGVDIVAKSFGLPIQKGTLDYKAFRPVGHELTTEEVDYLRNDVEIMARAIQVLFDQGLDKMTQAGNAFHDYKKTVGDKNFDRWFPTPTYDADVRQAYKGGFTYLRPEFANKDLKEILVFDINSLYPHVMRNKMLPYGEGVPFRGKYESDDLYTLYVQMLTCQFELKPGHIPTIQLKNTRAFIPTEYLSSSGDEFVTMCLTSVDLELFFEHYNVYNEEYHGGWKFKGAKGILFKQYIDKWSNQKIESKRLGNKGMYTLCKLMLNALYGRFAISPLVASKIPYYDQGVIKFQTPKEEYTDETGKKRTRIAYESRNPIYVPVAAFITAWARHTTITAAQKLYPYFRYSDTDSIHLEMEVPQAIRDMSQKELEELTTKDLQKLGLPVPDDFEVDPYKLGAWKLEMHANRARFLRQKSYIEDMNAPETWGNPEQYDRDKMKITCAGMPVDCYSHVTWENFHPGSTYPGKKVPKHVVGGIVLEDTDFTIRQA